MFDIQSFESNGYTVCRNVIDQSVLYNLFAHKENWNYPQRGHSLDGQYYNNYDSSVEWGNYWTESLSEHKDVVTIEHNVRTYVDLLMHEPVFYHSDVSVIMPSSCNIRPHVDTPNRHAPWNNNIDERLGIQVAIPMQAFVSKNGSTAFLPKSHNKVWDITQCYRGEYTQQFLSGCVQPIAEFSDMIIWDARTLHSQMPNLTDTPRYMLLFNYVEKQILSELIQFEAGF